MILDHLDRRASRLVACLALIVPVLWAGGAARADATTAPAVARGLLLVHVTAVQGGAQFRLPGETKWQMLANGLDLTEGVEFRTGPRGTVQFTVGTDQVFRVDRLTVVKVLRASLLPDGNIKTDVGMTYGRVSKDVDQPARPHEDTIVSPAATLAVRGTRVSLYDQPPYAPEATSLTGTGEYSSKNVGLGVLFGKKHEGTARVGGDSDSSAHYQLSYLPLDPRGPFDGLTPPEEIQIADGDNLQGPIGQLIYHQDSMIGGQVNLTSTSSGSGGPIAGQLNFGMTWTAASGSALDTVVNFSAISPLSEMVSPSMPGPVPSGGFYAAGSSTVANSMGAGSQMIQWGTSYATPGSSYPPGTYTLTETLNGTLTQTLAQAPTTAVTVNTFGIEYATSGAFKLTNIGTTTLNISNPTQTYSVSVPSLTVVPPVMSSDGVGSSEVVHVATNFGPPASAITAIRGRTK